MFLKKRTFPWTHEFVFSDLYEEYSLLVKDHAVPPVPPSPTPKPLVLSPEWFRGRKKAHQRTFLPPLLQLRFPLNLVRPDRPRIWF